VPLYYQLAELLGAQIRRGDLPPGSQLPPERELSEQYGISRMTVRQALACLVADGSLTVHQGLGTFVAEPKLTANPVHLLSFTEAMIAKGAAPSSRVLEQRLVIPPEGVARGLELAPPAEVTHKTPAGEAPAAAMPAAATAAAMPAAATAAAVSAAAMPAAAMPAAAMSAAMPAAAVKIVRLRLSAGVPLVLETVHVPAHLCPGLEHAGLATASLYALFETVYGLKLARTRQTLESAAADDAEAELFGLPRGTPMILLSGITYLDDGRPAEHFKAIYRGDRFKFAFEGLRSAWAADASAAAQGSPHMSVILR
jgi:GntR family transcriptional regulator